MMGLPVSPPFANNIANDTPGVCAPAVQYLQVTPVVVDRELNRKRKVYELIALNPQLVTPEESDLAEIRFHQAVAQAAGEMAVARPCTTALKPLREALRSISAHQLNEKRVFTYNQKASLLPKALVTVVRAPYKMAIGFAAAPPIAAMNPTDGIPHAIMTVLSGEAPLPGVDAVPPESFSVPTSFCFDMAPEEIGYLCRYYNDTFGIVEGDDRNTQNFKLKNFLLGVGL
eukprot:gene10196-21251_t